MQQQMNGQGQGQGNGRGRYQARRARPGDQTGDDPLGRRRRAIWAATRPPARNGSVSERARKVMEELRRRLADPNRPAEERDYLERLMKRE